MLSRFEKEIPDFRASAFEISEKIFTVSLIEAGLVKKYEK